jgi:hypothetical protein
MKPILIVVLLLTTGLGVACSRQNPESSQPPQTQPQAAPPPAAPPPAAPPATPAATAPAQQSAGSQPAAAPQGTAQSVAPAAPAPLPPAPAPIRVEPPKPKFRDVTISAGTALSVTVLSNLASNTSKVEDLVKGALARPIVVEGLTVVPQGAELRGVVTDAKSSGRVKGKASIGLAFDRVVVRGEPHDIQTAPLVLGAEDKKSDDVKKGAVGGGLGAVVGGIAGGGTGAAIGAVAGATGTVLATKGREVQVQAGAVVEVLLQSPLTVRVPLK